MISAVALLLLPALALARPVESPRPDKIQIVDTARSGNGCPQNTVSTVLSKDHSKSLEGLLYPGGFHFPILDAAYHGFARLDEGVTADFLSSYYFSQSAASTSITRGSISGPAWLKGNVYVRNDKVANGALIWSPCGSEGILNINNRISFTSQSPKASGELSSE
ncbi:hypothetical protein GX50_04574 [[Emmonsia] crescens]|uniref:Uncharacterized protein n=1 Tax=[Emmonsia] crescens TaxID=73230 RepID=A0A2B7ZHK9_9EURO|nr:hypothetical protein GX50_04574 [Emmonsia crescens]